MTLFFTDRLCLGHDPAPWLLDRPARLQSILAHLEAEQLTPLLSCLPGRDATVDELARCHSRYYIDALANASRQALKMRSRTVRVMPDTFCDPDSYTVAVRAGGTVLAACEAVAERQGANAFAAVRPVGHQAAAGCAYRGSLFNHAAIAARHCQQALGYGKVAIADFDAHHGRGTQSIFYDDPSVLVVSVHQDEGDPAGSAEATGEGEGDGATINRPLARDADRGEVVSAWVHLFDREIARWKPDFLILSAGFDGTEGDPASEWMLGTEDYMQITQVARDVAGICCGGRLVSVLEGGYDLALLPQYVEGHLEILRHGPGTPDWVLELAG